MGKKLLTSAERIAANRDQTGSAAVMELTGRLAEVFDENLQFLTLGDDHVPVHKARVALRRFRVMITAFAPILDDDLADAMHHRSRTLFRILGPIRDADVITTRLAEAEDDQFNAVMEDSLNQRRKARRLLKKKKAASFQGWVAKRMAGKSWRRTGKKAKALRDAPVAVLAKTALAIAWKRCGSNGSDLHKLSLLICTQK